MPSKRGEVLEKDLGDEDFNEPRRSSLQVNLSYISNVTDSGHGSSKRFDETITDFPDTKVLPVRGRRTRRNLPSKESEPPKKRQRNLPKIIKVQSNINKEEQALNDSCSQLKDAILRKTREIFDQGNELAIKTSRVLEEGSKMIRSVQEEFSRTLILDPDSMSVILEKDSRSVIIEKDIPSRSTISENNTDSMSRVPESEKDSKPLDESKNSKPPGKSLKSMILEMSTNTRSTLLEKMKESKLIPQTDQNNRSPSVRVALREDLQIIMSGKNTNYDPVRINVMNSPVSSRSSRDEFSTPIKSRVSEVPNENQIFPKKRLFSDENNPEDGTSEKNFQEPTTLQKRFLKSLESSKPMSLLTSPILSGNTRKRSRLALRRTQTQKENEKGQRNKDSSVKETQNVTDMNSPGFPLTCSSFTGNRNQTRNPDIGHFSGRGTNELSCMEITTIPNILPISVRGSSSGKQYSEKKIKESFKGSQDKRVLSMELTEAQGNILDPTPPQEVNSEFVEGPDHVVNDKEVQDDSVRTARTSLNVNTSMDVTEGKKSGETVCPNSSCGSSNRSKKTQQSSCMIRSSLKVNTSLDYLPKLTRKKLSISEVPAGRNSQKVVTVKENPISDAGTAEARDLDPVGSNTDNHKRCTIPLHFFTCPDQGNSNTMADPRNVVVNAPSTRSIESNPAPHERNPVENKSTTRSIKFNSVSLNSTSKNSTSENSASSESLENVSLMERLKGFTLKPSTSVNITRTSRSLNSTKDGIGERSYVEGTPLPITRSFLWKSQIRQNTFASNLHFNTSEKSNETNFSEKTTESIESGRNQRQFTRLKKIGRHPALDDSESETTQSSHKSLGKITTESNKSSRVEDSSSDNSKKPRKKKLYPLRGHSQLLSLSPARSTTPSPKRIVFPKRRKNRKWLKMQNTQNTQKSLKTQKTQNKSSAESTEDESANVPAQDLTKRKKARKVLRKKIIIKKIASKGILSEMERNGVKFNESENSEGGRSSLNDFEPKKKAEKNKRNVKRIIVTTGLSNEDKSLVKSVVKKLGKAEMELNVSRKTTHVISTGVRTINLLKGIIRGCWLVSLEWVLNSLENGSWIHPEPYEMAHFSAAVQENRRDRQLFGNAFVPELFSTCGPIYVENGTNPSSSSLKELIKIAGGQVTEDPVIAKILIGSEGLKEIWVLDSITTGELQPVDDYKRK